MGETGEAYIVGPDHLIRSTSRFWTEAKEEYKQDVKITGVPQKTIELMDRLNTTIDLQEIPNSIVESAIAGDAGITQTNNNYRGKEVFTTYGPLDLRGLDWALIAEMEVQEVYAPSRRLLIILSIAGVIFLLLSAAVADLASKLLLKPIDRLIEKTNKIAAGEANTDSLDENNEFGELEESINTVASNLDRTSVELSTEKQANEALLHNILAPAIAQRKNKGELVIADRLSKVTIVYAHLVGIEELERWMSPSEITALLTDFKDEFDRLAENYGLERQPTPGTEYMAVCGLTQAMLDLEKRAVNFARAILDFIKKSEQRHRSALGLSIGIHAGELSAGVIGTNNFGYNLWGQTLDLATRLYPHIEKNQILVTRPVYERISNSYTFIPRLIKIDNFGKVETWNPIDINIIESDRVELIQSSFAEILTQSEKISELFYQRLFELNPSSQPMLEGSADGQRKFISILAASVNNLDNPAAIVPSFKKLGRFLIDGGVTLERYEDVRDSLFWALARGLGDDFTPRVREAWAEFYRFLYEIMKATPTIKPAQSRSLTENISVVKN